MAQILFLIGAAAATPAANYSVLYAKSSDKKLYLKDDTGTEYSITTPATTDGLTEGVTNLYFTEARVRATVATGLSDTAGTPAAADSLLTILGKIKKGFFTDHSGAGGAVHANAVAAGAAGFMTGADKTKIDGIAAGATANSTDAFLLARANHTGTQLLSTISDAGTVASLASDADGTLAANSDARVATQKAVKTYIDLAVTGLLEFKGSTDCSSNPNYPAASKGDSYVVTVAGKIGGASGTSVDVGDVYAASADNAGGTEAGVGTSWFHLEHNLVGALLSANNLSDLVNAGTARTNLGLSANGSSLVTAANYAAMLVLLSLNNLTNDAQTKVAIVPNTAPAAGYLLIGNVGGTAYAPVAASGDLTVASTGAFTVANDAISYAKIQNVSATSRILARKTAAAGDVEEATLSEILDFVGSAVQGDILYRDASSWARLAAGTSGYFLKTQGAAANPVWASNASTPAGSDTQVQYNSAGAFGASTGLTYNDTDKSVTLGADLILQRSAAATFKLGGPNSATPVAQTISFQGSRGGTDSNVAAVTSTIIGSLGTGTGTVGAIEIHTGTVAASGTTAHAAARRMEIKSTLLTSDNPIRLGPSGASAGTWVSSSGSGNLECGNGAVGGGTFKGGRFLTTSNSCALDETSAPFIGLGLGTGASLFFSSTAAWSGTTDLGIIRSAAGILSINDGSKTAANYRDLKARHILVQAGALQLGSFTVATLPSAATYPGGIAYVTDASTTLVLGLGGAITGGGANKTPAWSDGTNWNYG